MKPSENVSCTSRPCACWAADTFMIPTIKLDPAAIRMVMVSECAPASAADYFYSKGKALFAATTIQAFRDAGEIVSTTQEILDLGVYLTTAIKCAKGGCVIPKEHIWNCSSLLEQEIRLFPNVRVLLLMGDAAIYAANCLAKRRGLKRVIPAGSTYKIRGGTFELEGVRLFPSYLQAGPSFYIEKTKRQMVAEDIASGMRVVREHARPLPPA